MVTMNQGPIFVINESSYYCDAFLAQRHRIGMLSLPNLSEELNEIIRHHSFRSALTLQWLWNVAANPILGVRGCRHPPLDNT